ncbi:FeoB-associated Cys-rich membrane protein [Clostridium sp. AN503]|uniref:FeoB-associated Cys-rich membrane protein n=1 Tax=Clostridium sp. AN503 TaxID=3160598 RepID=UPI003459B70A
MIVDIVIAALIFGYCAYVIYRQRKDRQAGGCTGCCGSCGGCSHACTPTHGVPAHGAADGKRS